MEEESKNRYDITEEELVRSLFAESFHVEFGLLQVHAFLFLFKLLFCIYKILNSFAGRSLTQLMSQQQHSLNRRELFAFKKESSALKFQTYGAIAVHVAAPPR